ncbi:MAG TPA: putative baseplate assembly protein, partial [Polyangia bacterium]|nr:putative baseplate assembly protein [Polyangia bacterium]
MPLSDLVPIIDDRTFDDLVAEARTRIPRYTPEWTDLNESDPGMALVELFGWMTDLLIYRLGKVPQLNYIKFLQLIGFELTPARPASAEVTFPVQPSFTQPYVIVPQATQIATETPDAAGPVIFELDRGLIALTAALDAILVYDTTYRDQSAANTAATGFLPFGNLAAGGAALLLGLSSTLPFPAVVVDLAFFTQMTPGVTPLACPGPGDLPSSLVPGTIAWEYWSGKSWLPLALVEDQTSALTQDGHVRLQAPSAGSLVLDVMPNKIDKPRYWLRARLV